MKKIIKLIFDSDLLHPDQKEKKNIEKNIDSIKIPFEEKEIEVWIDKSYNDRITIDRKDFVDELSRALYYNVISKKASTIFLQWFDEHENTKSIDYESNFDIDKTKEMYQLIDRLEDMILGNVNYLYREIENTIIDLIRVRNKECGKKR